MGAIEIRDNKSEEGYLVVNTQESRRVADIFVKKRIPQGFFQVYVNHLWKEKTSMFDLAPRTDPYAFAYISARDIAREYSEQTGLPINDLTERAKQERS